jgi:hypothetical protein
MGIHRWVEKRRIAPGRVLTILLGLGASSALAVEPVRAPLDLNGFHPLGKAWWRPAFSMQDVGYDDNLFLSPEDSRIGDSTATFAPQADFIIPFGDRGDLKGVEQVSYTVFEAHGEENFLSDSSTLHGDFYAGPWGISTDARYVTTRVRPTEEVDIRPRRSERGLRLEARYEHARRIGFNLYVGRDETSFGSSDPSGQFEFRTRLNRAEDSVGGAVSYRVGRRTDFVVETVTRRVDFSAENALTPVVRQTRTVAGFDWRPPGRIFAQVRAGNLKISPEDLPSQAFDGLAWSTSFIFPLFARVSVKVNGSRDTWLSALENNLFALSTRGGIAVATSLIPKATLELGAELSRTRYSDIGADVEPRRDRGTRAYVGGRYLLSDRSTVGLRLSRFLRNTNVEGEDASQFTASASLGWVF